MEDKEHPVIAFGLAYGNELVFCEAVMQENYYDVHFGGNWIASIEHTEYWDWAQIAGIELPEAIIDEIGSRIEYHYNQ